MGRGKAAVTPMPQEEPHPPAEGEREEARREEVSDWDLSLATLGEAIMAIEDDSTREERLARLTDLVGALSTPPPQLSRRRMHNMW